VLAETGGIRARADFGAPERASGTSGEVPTQDRGALLWEMFGGRRVAALTIGFRRRSRSVSARIQIMRKSHFVEAAEACVANGERLLDDADFVSHPEHPAGTSFALAMIAQEEFAKAFLLWLAYRSVITWNSFVCRATRDHTCKQLLGLVMKHLNPDWDEEAKRDKEWWAEHEEHKGLLEAYQSSTDKNERDRMWKRIEEISAKHNSLPSSVTDAIFILRYEKIGRWKSSTWVWEEEPVYDPLAKSLAEGKLDREKQDALYVRLGHDGHVAKTPAQVKYEDAKAAMDIADRMRYFVKFMLAQNDVAGMEYEKIESAFKSAFASLCEKDANSLAI
jgi:AbiV family abortive infection protein